MYCKKCGTEHKEGQKFCPKCGTPFLDENGKPYLKGIKKDYQDAKDKLTSKAKIFTKQGKKLVCEKVQPHINENVEELKNVNWNKRKESFAKTMQWFISNVGKHKIVCWSLAIVILCLFYILFIPNSSNSISSISNNISEQIKEDNASVLFKSCSEKSGPREICITLNAETDRGIGPDGRMKNVISSSGNYGFRYDEGKFYTDEIIVPNGKSWTYKDYEVHYKGGEGCVPDVRHYYMGYNNVQYKTYNCRNDSRNIPIFRSNDKIKIMVSRWDEGSPKTMEVKVYFIEKDDDLQLSN